MGPRTENLQPVNFSEMSHNLSEPMPIHAPSLPTPRRPVCALVRGTRLRPRVAVGPVSKALIDVRL